MFYYSDGGLGGSCQILLAPRARPLSLSLAFYTHTQAVVYISFLFKIPPLSLSSCAHLMCRVRREPARELVVE